LPRLVPKREFHPVPEAKLVVNHPQVILYDVLADSEYFRHFIVLQAICNELDDPVFAFTWDAAPVAIIC